MLFISFLHGEEKAKSQKHNKTRVEKHEAVDFKPLSIQHFFSFKKVLTKHFHYAVAKMKFGLEYSNGIALAKQEERKGKRKLEER